MIARKLDELGRRLHRRRIPAIDSQDEEFFREIARRAQNARIAAFA